MGVDVYIGGEARAKVIVSYTSHYPPHPLTVERAVPLRLNKKVKNSANSETESEDDQRPISAYHIP